MRCADKDVIGAFSMQLQFDRLSFLGSSNVSASFIVAIHALVHDPDLPWVNIVIVGFYVAKFSYTFLLN